MIYGRDIIPWQDEAPPYPEAESVSFLHAVVTRFNVGCTDAAWLEHRVRLFERFTLPSVQAQTRQDFHWLLLCDRMTSGVWKNRLRAYESENTHLVWTARGDKAWRKYLRDLLAGDETHVITTRLDNDDAVSRCFVEDIQTAASPDVEREFLNFPLGYLWFRGRITRKEHRSNSFISCCEPIGDLRTVYCRQHVHLARVAPVRQLGVGTPHWLRVCHDRNWLNKPPRGKDVCWEREEVLTTFGLNLEAPLPNPAGREESR